MPHLKSLRRGSFDPSELIIGGAIAREFVRISGSVLAADSPRGMYLLLETFYELGIDKLITEYFGERPALSAEKTTLRKVVPGIEPGGWHQDGQFLGTSIRSLEVWIALSDCAVDAAGLELVPTRRNHIVATGTNGAEHDWCASHALSRLSFQGR